MMSDVKEGDVLVLQGGMEVNVRRIAKDDSKMFPYTVWNEGNTLPYCYYDEDGNAKYGPDWGVIGVIRMAVMTSQPAVDPSAGATAPSAGVKHDQGKPDYSLLTRAMVEPMIRALMYGEKKYNRGNFRNGFTNTRLAAAAMRHIMTYLDREDLDPESGVQHLGHAMAALGMLLDNEANGKSTEGRYEK